MSTSLSTHYDFQQKRLKVSIFHRQNATWLHCVDNKWIWCSKEGDFSARCICGQIEKNEIEECSLSTQFALLHWSGFSSFWHLVNNGQKWFFFSSLLVVLLFKFWWYEWRKTAPKLDEKKIPYRYNSWHFLVSMKMTFNFDL